MVPHRGFGNGRSDRAIGAVALGVAVGAPALTAVLARPVGGRLADRFGPRPLVLAGAGVMTVAGLPAALSPTLGAPSTLGAGLPAVAGAVVLSLRARSR